MRFELLAQQPLAVLIHLATVVPAFLLGTWLVFFSKKGAAGHRAVGSVYLALMTVTATATIFVTEIRRGHWSWLHLFIPLTWWSVFAAIWQIRQKDIAGHKRAMWGLYIGGLLIAGGLTFTPGRLMGRLFGL